MEQSCKLQVSSGEMETKMLISHKCLWNCIELIENVKQSICYLDEDCKHKKLLNYTIQLFEIFAKFCEVYFDYKTKYVVNRFNFDTAAELSNVCNFTIEIMKFVKVCVSVILRKNPRSQDIIKNICFKAIFKYQNYLVAVDYFNKEMFRKSALNL